MKNKDSVKYIDEHLYVNFDATGTTQRASVFNVAQGMTFHVDGDTLFARAHGNAESELMVERFANESQAWKGLDRVQKTLISRAHWSSIGNVGRSVARYVGIPLGVVFLVAAVTGTVSAHRDAESSSTPTSSFLASAPMSALPVAPPSVTSQSDDFEHLAVSSKQVADALKQGAASGRYAVKLGSAKGDPVYVFEDPQCTHCQDFAPELNKLAKTRPVYVIPVSAIGGPSSAALNAQTLCADEEKREKTWNMAMSGALSIQGPTQQTPSQACVQAAEANDLIYQTIGLKATPTLFDSQGHKMPYRIKQTADSVNEWLTAES